MAYQDFPCFASYSFSMKTSPWLVDPFQPLPVWHFLITVKVCSNKLENFNMSQFTFSQFLQHGRLFLILSACQSSSARSSSAKPHLLQRTCAQTESLLPSLVSASRGVCAGECEGPTVTLRRHREPGDTRDHLGIGSLPWAMRRSLVCERRGINPHEGLRTGLGH